MREPNTENHYCDSFVELFNSQEHCMWVMANCHGESEAISYDDNFYTPFDLLRAYRKLTKDDEASDEAFKKWLIDEAGCEPELLEDED